MRVGIIGCGKIGQRHAEVLTSLDDVELTGLCDIDAAQLDAVGELANAAERYSSYTDMLSKSNIETVVIATPNGLHAEIAVAALNAHKHVILEKPIALSLPEVDCIVAASESSGKTLFVVKQNRFNESVFETKKAIDGGKLGKLFLIEVRVPWHRPSTYYNESPWKGTRDQDGGALFTQACHFLDLMHWTGGRITSVDARMGTFVHTDTEIEDVGSLLVQFESGAIGTFSYMTCTYAENHKTTMNYWGTEGTVILSGASANQIEYWNVKNTPQPVIEDEVHSNNYGAYRGSSANHHKLLPEIFNYLADPHPNDQLVIGREGRHTIEVICAAADAARSGRRVHL